MRRRDEAEAVCIAKCLQGLADFLVGGYAAGHHKSRFSIDMRKFYFETRKATADTVFQGARHRLLEGGADIGNILLRKRRDGGRSLPHRCLQAREGKIEPCFPNHRARERKTVRSPFAAAFSTAGPPG